MKNGSWKEQLGIDPAGLASAARTPSGEVRISIPWNLTDWVQAESLRDWVRAEIGQLDWDDPAVREYVRTRGRAHPRSVLGVLVYAYATGMFESEEIALACGHDAGFRALSGDAELTPAQLARFRRENRALLKWALMRVMVRALFDKLGENCSKRLPAGLRHYLEESARERLDCARHLDRGASEN
jgi:hypothetical protein